MVDDTTVQGQDQTPGSQTETQDQQADSNQVRPLEQQAEEEVEFNNLSGSAQERVRELVRRAKDAEGRAATTAYVPPAPQQDLALDQRQALDTLSQFGVATDEKVDRKIQENLNSLRWDMENGRLESKYDGSNGGPQYVKEEVEDYIRTHPQLMGYAPEDVFKFKMFPDEFSNLEAQQRGSNTGRSSTLRPTKANVMQEALSPEAIERRLQEPDGQQWYEEHLDEINKVVTNHTLQFKGKV